MKLFESIRTNIRSTLAYGVTDVCLIIVSSAPFLLSAYFLLFRSPQIWPDEAIYIDTAKNILDHGVLATNIFGGAIPGLEEHAYWYPPLYFYLLAGWMLVFGSTIESVRLLTILITFASLVIIYFFAKSFFGKRYFAALTVFLVVLDPHFSESSRVARMDMLCLLFWVLSLLFFYLALTKNKLYLYGLSGIFAGIDILTHPLGFLAPAVCGISLWLTHKPVKEKLKYSIVFGIPVLIAILGWLYYMKDGFSLFLSQYNLQFQLKAGQTSELIRLFQFDIFSKLLFIVYGLALFLSFLFGWGKKSNVDWIQRWQVYFLLVGAFFSVFVILWGKVFWYMLYLQPFAAFILIYLLRLAIKKRGDVLFTIVLGIFLFVVGVHGYLLWNTFQNEGKKEYNYHDFTARIKKELPKKANVFLAVIPDPYFDLQFNKNMTLYEFPTVPVSEKAYIQLLNKSDYIVINILPHQYWIIQEYVKKNSEKEIQVKQPGGYSAKIIKLKPQSERK